MHRVLHVVVTDNFAGVERYASSVARATQEAGWPVTVVGGAREPMISALGPSVRWLPGGTLWQAARSVRRAGAVDVCHVHMTYAEAVGVLTRGLHHGHLVSTRHFAAHRGSSWPGRLSAGVIRRELDAEIAISSYVAAGLDAAPTLVLPNGVADREVAWGSDSRTVLVMQRLEPEKQTATALHAWAASGLAAQGWCLRVVGEGSQRTALETLVAAERIPAVTFAGWVADVDAELARAGVLLASAPREPLGLVVLEAMAAGVPVVAAAGGGHLETVDAIDGAALFPPDSAVAAGALLARLAGDDGERARLSAAGRSVQRQRFSLSAHMSRLIDVYRDVIDGHLGSTPAPVS